MKKYAKKTTMVIMNQWQRNQGNREKKQTSTALRICINFHQAIIAINFLIS